MLRISARALLTCLCTAFSVQSIRAQADSLRELTLQDAALRLQWTQTPAGWKLRSVAAAQGGGLRPFGQADGSYVVLYAANAPDKDAVPIVSTAHPNGFPELNHKYIAPRWKEATSPVSLNTAGQVWNFLPAEGRPIGSALEFIQRTEVADLTARWELDPQQPGDIRVAITLTARRSGWFSLASPTLASLKPNQLGFAMVPGYFQGQGLEKDFVRAYGYGHGLPDRPVVVRERAASTLAPLLTDRAGLTLAAIPEPGTATDPWEKDASTRPVWRLGLSHMNRSGDLTPTLYSPVLGEAESHMNAGDQRTLRFRYVLRAQDWYSTLKYAARSIYRLDDFLAMKRPVRALSNRLAALRRYVTDDQTSLWRTEQFGGLQIGAQAYLGGVLGSDRDAMKNSDYGAMWMLAHLTDDPKLRQDRLPWARNFKLVQQQDTPGFFQGAATGQYYLSKSRRFTEEWGDYVEPVALTYYALLDLGNILLFEPGDAVLRERLRLGADRLLSWQHADGHWEVAYDRATQKPLFTELPDLRPTFYGLVVAHRVLGDDKYLSGARRGADWLLQNAVGPTHYLGVCGDTRFAPDFATAQIAQALLDLAEITGDQRYRDGGIAAARFYTSSIYTHPMATRAPKSVGGVARADWEINQTGLGFEHGGVLGSANTGGPILLASHAGLFVRVAQLTGDDFFLDLARAAVWARDAFVDPATSVASYYWSGMNRGAGPFPHHAWWQIGWITDYFVSELEYRSKGAIHFPRGFFTPKVGPHAGYGSAPGQIYGRPADLRWGTISTSHTEVDCVLARSKADQSTYIMVLNNSTHAVRPTLMLDTLEDRPRDGWKSAAWLDAEGREHPLSSTINPTVELPATGLLTLILH